MTHCRGSILREKIKLLIVFNGENGLTVASLTSKYYLNKLREIIS